MDDDDDDDVDDDNDDNYNNDDDDNDSPPGINDTLAFNIDAFQKGYNPSWRQLKKWHKNGGGGEERIQRSQCCAGVQSSIPPPAQGRSRSRSGSNDATVKQGSKAPSPYQGGKKRSRSNVAMVVRRGKPPSPPQSQRGSNPQQTQRNKRTKKGKTKKRSKSPFLSPTQGRISCNPSTNTLSTGGSKNDSFATPQSFESPQFDYINVGRETFLNDDTDK